jgi:hypothetical protein
MTTRTQEVLPEPKEVEPSPPTDWEIDMAFTWTILNTIRLFHEVLADDILPAEERFLQKWKSIPVERRKTALDFEFPATLENQGRVLERGGQDSIRHVVPSERKRVL